MPLELDHNRLIDAILAAALALGLSPLLLARALMARWATGRVFEAEPRIGLDRQPFQALRFAGPGLGASWAALFNLLRGDVAWVGPRPLAPGEAAALAPEYAPRFGLRPGVVSPFAVRRNVGIAHRDEFACEHECFFGAERPGRFGVLARYLIGRALSGDAHRPMPPTLDFFGVTLANTTMGAAIDWIVERARARRPAQIAFVNPDCLNIAYRHAAYHRVLTQAARVLPDGIGIHLGCRILGLALRENVNGTDLFPRLCERCAGEGLSLYLLGARPGVAAAAAAEMQRRYPGLKIAGTRDGYFGAADEAQVLAGINASGADILLVALGAPRQELWLAEHAAGLAPTVRLGVGGLFDFYSGRIPRAPLWMREIGLEWTWRLIQEPGRMWRRYVIGNPLFLFRVWRQKLAGGHP